jgi:hypothetical protein
LNFSGKKKHARFLALDMYATTKVSMMTGIVIIKKGLKFYCHQALTAETMAKMDEFRYKMDECLVICRGMICHTLCEHPIMLPCK